MGVDFSAQHSNETEDVQPTKQKYKGPLDALGLDLQSTDKTGS